MMMMICDRLKWFQGWWWRWFVIALSNCKEDDDDDLWSLEVIARMMMMICDRLKWLQGGRVCRQTFARLCFKPIRLQSHVKLHFAQYQHEIATWNINTVDERRNTDGAENAKLKREKILACFGAKGANLKTGSSYVIFRLSILLHTKQIT